jgi:histone deacetylase 1/2
MENSNSREYLDKITAAVIDNLRNTGPAPSVQMQDVPRKPFGGMTDEEEAELDDLDEDENKDVRMTEHRWDKHVEHSAEFEASDDDEMARANGATRQSSTKRTFTDYKADGEDESGRTSPHTRTNEAEADTATAEDVHDANDDTIEDVTATEQSKEVPGKDETSKEAEPEKVDGDGDAEMADPAPAEEDVETPIKKEDGEPEAAPESDTAVPAAAAIEATDETVKPSEAEEAPAKTEATEEDPKPAEEATEEKTEPSETKDKEAPAADAMEVDGDKDKEAETKEPETTL